MTIAAGQRLVALSGLSGVSAAEHLRAIAGSWGTAGEMLVAYSGLGSETAAVHIMYDPVVSEPPAEPNTFVGYAPGAYPRELPQDRKTGVDIERQNQVILAVVMAAITKGIIR